jgi:hypothetical protein
MDIKVSQEQGRVPVTVFRVKGQMIDPDELHRKAKEAFDSGSRNLVLDLSEVNYMSSSGLRALHQIYTMLRTDAPEEGDEAVQKGVLAGTFKSPHLKLANPSRNVLEVLRATGYDMFLSIHKNVKDAVASF